VARDPREAITEAIMQAFGYYDPTSVTKAVGIIADKPNAKFLAGGQSLLATMKLRLAAPSDLVDLAQIPELRGVRVEPGGTAITVGAMTRHSDVATSLEIGTRIAALAALAAMIGDRQVRNRGTLGGSIANNDPASDYPAALLGLNATINTDKRKITADAFFTDLYETSLAPGELVVSVTFPVPKKAAYMKFRNPASRFALVGVFAAQLAAGGVRVAVTGAGARGVFRAHAMEEALAKNWSPAALSSIEIDPADMQADLHASAEYRAHLVNVMARRAVAAA
jgi:aerobic carbon-monoxide dehydrogenase medium subunit